MTSGPSKLKALRVFRILRILKILRIVRATRLLRRWECHMTLSYSTLNIAKFIGVIVVVSHWMACIWGAMASVESVTTYTWVSAWLEKQTAAGVFADSSVSSPTIVNGYYMDGVYHE